MADLGPEVALAIGCKMASPQIYCHAGGCTLSCYCFTRRHQTTAANTGRSVINLNGRLRIVDYVSFEQELPPYSGGTRPDVHMNRL